jgi:hypothetical protein
MVALAASVCGEDRWQETFVRSSPLCRLSGAPRLPPSTSKSLLRKRRSGSEEAKRVMELDRNLIVIAVLIVALPIIAALAAMLTVLAVGGH